jgi:MFS transporter, FSR family, fosmidomycin resistance protein
MSAIPARRLDGRLPLLALSLGHACADLSNSALMAVLPFLVDERHYSYAQAGLYAFAVSIAAAVLQPLLGAHGDRGGGFWFMPGGLVVAGLGIGVVGLTMHYPATLAAVAFASAGVAAYHPEGARWARRVAGERITSDMGVFSLGGSVGYALGPLVVAAALAPLGLQGTVLIPVVPIAAAAVLVLALRHRRRPGAAAASTAVHAGASQWRPFVRLLLFTCVGGAVTAGLLTYVPLFLLQERGVSPAASNVVTSVFLAAGAAGTLLGGLAADRYGRRVVLVAPQIALVPLIAAMPALGFVGMLPVVALAGLAMNSYMSVTLVSAQEYLPAHMGLATGLTVGFASGVAGAYVALLGLLGDSAGITLVLLSMAALPLLAAALGASLPRAAAPDAPAQPATRSSLG